MRRLLCIFSLLTLVFMTSCGYHEGITSPADESYLTFTGNTEGAVVFVEGHQPFQVEPGNKAFRVTPGKKHIRVEKNGLVVVERDILLGDQQTREVEIP